MGDYPITETLTRTLALERLKHLADVAAEARSRGDIGMMAAVDRERKEIRDAYLKVIK